MALAIRPPQERKRVKVYELRDNDWFDRGTGFCTGEVVGDVPKIFVESEDEAGRILLDTVIRKDESYQKQQETLIVWTESNGVDMALSFQEAEGCAAIWDYVNNIQAQMIALAGDEALSEDAMDSYHPSITLPPPELGNLAEIEQAVRAASMSPSGRDALSKFILHEEYIRKLVPLVEMAEDLESLPDLHRLCNIMKTIILLNDNYIIESVVTDGIIEGVVGALEYDPEFPTHKANHRQYLSDKARYKEVVPMKDGRIQDKIRHTWRLQYLKDVVLARILDDPTFSVLNSLIFFNQVDIINHIQSNASFLKELFAIFDPRNTDQQRKEDAVSFLHQCATIAKNLQASARASLFTSFINHGLFAVIAFAIKHSKPAMRTTGIDILVALLDHDPVLVRGYMLKAVAEKRTPLTDTLIGLLHTEADMGVKIQLADALKIFLDPQIPGPDPTSRVGAEFLAKLRPSNTAAESVGAAYFEESARKLFAPFKSLEGRSSVADLSFHEITLFSHLTDVLTFFVRQHLFRCRNFIHGENLVPRVAQLLTVPQKHLKLTALKFFKTLVNLQDTFYLAQLTHNNIFGLILDIIFETMPRDNLLNSACLELFEYIRRENIKPVITHLVEKHRDQLKAITYVDTFQNLIMKYDQFQGNGVGSGVLIDRSNESPTSQRGPVNGQRWQGVRELDPAEEEYFNTSDGEEDKDAPAADRSAGLVKLVDYPDDDDDEEIADSNPESGPQAVEAESSERARSSDTPSSPMSTSVPQTPPERISEKRRRDAEDDDELIRLSQSGPKRRSSSASSGGSTYDRRRKSPGGDSITSRRTSPSPSTGGVQRKISINLGAALKSSVETESIQLGESEDRDERGQSADSNTSANSGG
ncbi:hypothetical protein VTN31DRAFT_4739 [Thermomyces dupontii]|uniref:uncharacterized protein n=1 Tax=Talaromyces thermophilus TaxID=28565 RepID=UPI003743CE9A